MRERKNNRRKLVYRFLSEYIEQHGYAPTIREIGDGVGISSTSNVHYYLQQLQEEGLITVDNNKPRTIQICSITHNDSVFQAAVTEALAWFEKNVSESCAECEKSCDFTCSGANAERCRAYRVALKLCQDYLSEH